MKSSKKRASVLTGIFVLLGVLILVSSILIVGNKNNTFKNSISAKAVFLDVNGLAKGNNVWYEGVMIGNVKNIDFVKDGVEVTFTIAESVLPHLHADSKAKLSSDGLIGNKILVLFGGSTTSPLITDNFVFNVEKAASTEEMMSDLQKNNRNLLKITDNFKLISTNMAEGKGNIGKLIKDEALVNSLQLTLVNLQKAGLNAEDLTSNLAIFSKKINDNSSLPNQLITDTTIFSSLKTTALQLKQAATATNIIANNLTRSSHALNDTSGTVGVLLNDREMATNLKLTMLNLQSSTHKLDETMEALQHNFLVRGFFKKKEKAREKSMKYTN